MKVAAGARSMQHSGIGRRGLIHQIQVKTANYRFLPLKWDLNLGLQSIGFVRNELTRTASSMITKSNLKNPLHKIKNFACVPANV